MHQTADSKTSTDTNDDNDNFFSSVGLVKLYFNFISFLVSFVVLFSHRLVQ